MMVSSTPNPVEENLAFRGFQFTDAIISPPAVTETESPPPRRRTSFNFLRRAKSTERMKSSRSVSGGKLTKRQSTQAREQEMAQQQREAAALASLELPAIPHAPSMQTFGGEDGRLDSIAIISNKAMGYTPNRPLPNGAVDMTKFHIPPKIPIPAIPDVDPYASAESITNRGRYSYASSAVSTINNPRRVRKRKDPTPFNILVVGARNSGKTSFVEFLRSSLALPPRKQRPSIRGDDGLPQHFHTRISPNFTSQYLETEMDDGERVGITIWDSEGLDKSIVDLQLREMSSFLESKFEETFAEEVRVIRSPGVRDTHIHCVFLMLDPLRLDMNIRAGKKANQISNGIFTNKKSIIHPPSPQLFNCLDEDLDLQVLRTFQGRTTVVPVISKADTITEVHMGLLKRTVWDSLKQANLDPLEALGLIDEDDDHDDSSSDDNSTVKHNSKRFDQRHEDVSTFRSESHAASQSDRHSPSSSHYHSASSSESSPTRYVPDHSRHSSSALPVPSVTTPNTSSTNKVGTPMPDLPLSILSPDPDYPEIIGRQFAWGIADPYNPKHCDFVRLKEAVFKEWRGELREASRELWYERWRSERLDVGGRKTLEADAVGLAR